MLLMVFVFSRFSIPNKQIMRKSINQTHGTKSPHKNLNQLNIWETVKHENMHFK